MMKKALTAIAAAATLAVVAVGAPSDARAQRRGGAVAAGVVTGLAAGALIGGAIASQQPAYAAPGYYGPGPYYAAPPQRYCEDYVWSPRRGDYVLRRFPC
jgi:hypothetical protein